MTMRDKIAWRWLCFTEGGVFEATMTLARGMIEKGSSEEFAFRKAAQISMQYSPSRKRWNRGRIRAQRRLR